MSDVSIAETEDEKAEQAGFTAGYDEGTPAVPVTEAAVTVDAPAAEPVQVETPAPAAPVKYARVTQDEWNNAKAMAGKVANLESQLAKLAGNAPNAEKIAQQVIESLRSQTPAGMTVELSDEDFADLAADFPELAKHTRTAFENYIKKAHLKGTGTVAPPAPPVDVDAVAERVRLRLEEDALTRTYPDWSEVVGRPPAQDAPIPDGNPYRVWLGKQNAAYQKAVNETNSYADIQASIADFKASQRTAAPDRAAARRAVIESAVQPSGDGQAPPPKPPKSVMDAFNEGYRDG